MSFTLGIFLCYTVSKKEDNEASVSYEEFPQTYPPLIRPTIYKRDVITEIFSNFTSYCENNLAVGLLTASCKVYVKYTSICIAHFYAKPSQMRSDMDHTVLPANYTMPAFTPQPQNIAVLWLVLILPSHKG